MSLLEVGELTGTFEEVPSSRSHGQDVGVVFSPVAFSAQPPDDGTFEDLESVRRQCVRDPVVLGKRVDRDQESGRRRKMGRTGFEDVAFLALDVELQEVGRP